MWWISDAVNSLRWTSLKRLAKPGRDVEVVLEVEVGILAADHVDLGEVLRLADLDGVRDEVVDVPDDRVRLL